MDDAANLDGNYRIEVSGWGYDNNFFVEQTDLFWDRGGDKKVFLRHTPPEGGIVFIRLLLPSQVGSTIPVAYQVAAVRAMDCHGQSEIRLKQMHPRPKVSPAGELASYSVEGAIEGCGRAREAKESSALLEREEILQ
jgi:hypothetical protein